MGRQKKAYSIIITGLIYNIHNRKGQVRTTHVPAWPFQLLISSLPACIFSSAPYFFRSLSLKVQENSLSVFHAACFFITIPAVLSVPPADNEPSACAPAFYRYIPSPDLYSFRKRIHPAHPGLTIPRYSSFPACPLCDSQIFLFR